jgi:hypothetical protein
MRFALVLSVSAVVLLRAGAALADGPPDAAKIRTAALQFEAGALAYKKGAYVEAASAFEAADLTVPSSKALRLAMKARALAGQGSRAATLAAQALVRYPSDEDAVLLAKTTLAELEPSLHKLSVGCASPCVLAVGARTVAGPPNTRWVVYVDPGRVTIGASFFGDAGSVSRAVDANAGASSELRFEPPAAPRPEPAHAPAQPASQPAAPTPTVAPVAAETAPREVTSDGASPAPSGLSPAFVVTGLAVTAALGGVTIWSGIDTRNNPGVDAVRAACAGKDESCPEYAAGRAHQTRTNVLLGATVGAAAITGVLAIFTRWSAPAKPSTSTALAAGVWVDHGAGLSMARRF